MIDQDPQSSPDRTTEPGPARPRLAWDAGRAVLLYLLVVLASTLLGMASLIVGGMFVMILATQVLCFFGLPFVSTRIFNAGQRFWLRGPDPRAIGPAQWGAILFGTVGLMLLLTNLTALTYRFLPAPPEEILAYYERFAADSIGEFVLLVVLVALLPGFCEEFAFRGVIQNGISRTYGPTAAVIATGFFFALAHFDPWHFAGLWGLGIVLGWLTLRTGSIWPAAAAHALNNGGALVVATWVVPDMPLETPTLLPWWLNILALVVTVISLRAIHIATAPPTEFSEHEVM